MTIGSRVLGAVIAVVAMIGGGWLWLETRDTGLPDTVATGNGRIEATEYDIATKRAARLNAVLVEEGDMVDAGQVLARMDTDDLNAQLREAEAGARASRHEKTYAQAIVAERRSKLDYANAELERVEKLVREGNVSRERVDQARTAKLSAQAALEAARVQVSQATAGIEAAEARIERLTTEIDDSTLTAPVGGRILYRLAEPGEVLGAGGKVVTLLDLTDVYMTIFLPTPEAGRVRVGSEARIVLDAIPEYTIPATVSFVAPQAQFTPKAVETQAERTKLMFRIKVRIDPTLLRKHVEKVKTGLPGVAYVKLDAEASWPETLAVRLPQ